MKETSGTKAKRTKRKIDWMKAIPNHHAEYLRD